MDDKSTDDLIHEIKSATDIEDYLIKNKENLLHSDLAGHLNMLLSEKGIKKADVVRRSLLDRTYVYKIFSGKKIPSRDKLLALAFGLGLSDEETNKMLRLSGNRELYARDGRDALILFALHRNMSVFEVNELLYEYRFGILNTSKE